MSHASNSFISLFKKVGLSAPSGQRHEQSSRGAYRCRKPGGIGWPTRPVSRQAASRPLRQVRVLATILSALALTITLATPVAAAASARAPTPAGDQTVIAGMIQRYVACFNRRDAAGILKLYSPEARISESGFFSRQWIDVREYAPKLQDKLSKYAERGAFITGVDVRRMEIQGDKAEVDLAVRAKQGVFSATKHGYFELARDAGGWKIVMDES